MVNKNILKKEAGKFTEEFKNFAFKEATLGAAVGIMLGAALRDVINSLVNDVLTPPIAHITSGIDFSSLYFVFGETKYESLDLAKESDAVIIYYGNFISEFITFLITALILFLIVYQITKIVSKFKKKEKNEEIKDNKICPYCKSKIHIEASICPYCTSKL